MSKKLVWQNLEITQEFCDEMKRDYDLDFKIENLIINQKFLGWSLFMTIAANGTEVTVDLEEMVTLLEKNRDYFQYETKGGLFRKKCQPTISFIYFEIEKLKKAGLIKEIDEK